MYDKLAIIALLALSACASPMQVWVNEQASRCKVMGGAGVFLSSQRTYECWGKASAGSIKIDVNKDVQRNSIERKLIFRATYSPI